MKLAVLFVIFLISAILANSRRSNFIIGGQVAQLGQFPSTVFLQLHLSNGMASCGGTLIDPLWVLTAAHCIEDVTKTEVYAGFLDLEQSPKPYEVLKMIAHENFHSRSMFNDIALLKLKKPISKSSNISPAKLPDTPSYEGLVVNTAGWGNLEGGTYSSALRYVSMQVTNFQKCQEDYKELRANPKERDSVVCFLTPGKGTCFGDSGSASYVKNTNIVVGLWAMVLGYVDNGTCYTDYPSVGTSVYYFKPWIENVIRKNTKSFESIEDSYSRYDSLETFSGSSQEY